MAAREFLFTSESVTEGHPDKVADQISDTVLDAVLRDDPSGRVACETLITTGLVVVAGEISTEIYVDIPKLVRERIGEIGYTHSEWGFDATTCGVIVAIDEQSPDIAIGVDSSYEVQHDPGDDDPLDRIVPPDLYDEKRLMDDRDFVYVNPTGKFVLGGPMGDTGLTGRKIIVDTYGGPAPPRRGPVFRHEPPED